MAEVIKPILLDETGKETNEILQNLLDRVVMLKGDKGDPGEKPVKGVDYFTPAEITDIEENVEGRVAESIIDDLSSSTDKVWSAYKVANKFDEVSMAKFPNVTIVGTPTINNGQISNFSSANYCRFPFIVNFQNRPFEIVFDITTGADVSNQHNVLDSEFGLAFAVRNSRFVVAISTNGTSWDIGEGVGTHVVNANHSYRIKMSWDLSQFILSYSTDGGESYIVDIVKTLTAQPYPKQIFIGVSSDRTSIFNGIINLNYATLTISNKVVWQGMDDVGLASRLAIDMSNIDEAGEYKVKEIVADIVPTKTSDLTNDSGYITSTDYGTSSKGGVIKANATYGIAINGSGNLYASPLSLADYNAKGTTSFVSKGTLDNVLAQYLKSQALTQAEYDSIVDKDNNTLYVIVE